MAVSYEWVAEHCKGEDIIDPQFSDALTLDFITQEPMEGATSVNIALVRNVGNEVDGLLDRDYFYVEDSKLQEAEDCAGMVAPRIYHRIVERVYGKLLA